MGSKLIASVAASFILISRCLYIKEYEFCVPVQRDLCIYTLCTKYDRKCCIIVHTNFNILEYQVVQFLLPFSGIYVSTLDVLHASPLYALWRGLGLQRLRGTTPLHSSHLHIMAKTKWPPFCSLQTAFSYAIFSIKIFMIWTKDGLMYWCIYVSLCLNMSVLLDFKKSCGSFCMMSSWPQRWYWIIGSHTNLEENMFKFFGEYCAC